MASYTSILRSQVFFTAQVTHYGVARSPRLVEKSPDECVSIGFVGALPVPVRRVLSATQANHSHQLERLDHAHSERASQRPKAARMGGRPGELTNSTTWKTRRPPRSARGSSCTMLSSEKTSGTTSTTTRTRVAKLDTGLRSVVGGHETLPRDGQLAAR